MKSAIEVQGDTILLHVHVSARAKKTQHRGRHGERIKISLSAIPEDGAANEELLRFLAKLLQTAKSNIELVSGFQSKDKTIRLTRVSADMVQSKLGA